MWLITGFPATGGARATGSTGGMQIAPTGQRLAPYRYPATAADLGNRGIG